MKRSFVLVLIAVVIGLAGVWLKVRIEAGASLSQAQALEEVGDISFAVVCYRRTIRWYTPGSAPVQTAVTRLQALGRQLEESGEQAEALLAYRALRTGILGVQSVFQPYEDDLKVANQRIAHLMAQQEMSGSSQANKTRADREAHHTSLLEKNYAPAVGWSLGAVFGFLLWCGCLLGLVRNGFDDVTGLFIRSKAIPWGMGVVISACSWMASLALA
jgi:hypothetical protein